jgi:hypothetical protein
MSAKTQEIALGLIDQYRGIRSIRSDFLSKKYRPLLHRHPTYKLFDFEHPYHDMDERTNDMIESFEKFIKEMLDVDIDGSSIRKELERIAVVAELSSETEDPIAKLIRKL